ncbi:hypothetical protein ABT063_34015, partial [Streptomyces sp. NPDC002838]
MMAVEGLACGVLNPIMATVMYETVPEELRSRVLTSVAPSGGTPVGTGGVSKSQLAADRARAALTDDTAHLVR